jgi:hypothetical protein
MGSLRQSMVLTTSCQHKSLYLFPYYLLTYLSIFDLVYLRYSDNDKSDLRTFVFTQRVIATCFLHNFPTKTVTHILCKIQNKKKFSRFLHKLKNLTSRIRVEGLTDVRKLTPHCGCRSVQHHERIVQNCTVHCLIYPVWRVVRRCRKLNR